MTLNYYIIEAKHFPQRKMKQARGFEKMMQETYKKYEEKEEGVRLFGDLLYIPLI